MKCTDVLESKALIRKENIVKWEEEDYEFYIESFSSLFDDLVEDIPPFSEKEFDEYVEQSRQRILALLK